MTRLSRETVWVLEREVFADGHEALARAIIDAGARVIDWKDEWLTNGKAPALPQGSVIFHGSLGNAALVAERLDWIPGAFCHQDALSCHNYLPLLGGRAAQRGGFLTTVQALVDHHERLLAHWPSSSIFVRPDSPLKPFSGRVLERSSITLRTLDHGFYYDDTQLAVWVAPPRNIGREWRFVIVDRQVVASSAYLADHRIARAEAVPSEVQLFAEEVASIVPAPERAYIIDVAEVDEVLAVLELNAFSGSDLYACDRRAVVSAIHRLLDTIHKPRHRLALPHLKLLRES